MRLMLHEIKRAAVLHTISASPMHRHRMRVACAQQIPEILVGTGMADAKRLVTASHA
jgi:hypothetical protein